MEFAQTQDAMARHASSLTRRDRGFSVIELLIVVAIVIVMAALAIPNIGRYIRNYKIKGAAQLVAGELHAARSRAVMSNTNSGVSFWVVDQESYRFIQEDLETTNPERLSSLKRLPGGIVFVSEPTGLSDLGPTLRFLRLGGFCNPAVTSSGCHSAADEADPAKKYIGAFATGVMEIRIRETTTGLERTIDVAPGGRVLPQP